MKRRKPATRPKLEPISYDEIMGNAGMSGFVSFLDVPEVPPASSVEPAVPYRQVKEGSTVQDSYTVQDAGAVLESPTEQETCTVEESDAVQEAYTASARSTVHESDTVQETSRACESDAVQQSKTVQQDSTVKEPCTVQAPTSVVESSSVQNADTVEESHSVEEPYIMDAARPQVSRQARVKRAESVEDGHSLAEEAVYRALWKAGAPEGAEPDANRVVRIGYDRLAALVRLSWVSVKANLRSLEKKLSIEVIAAEDSAHREGKRYRVYSDAAVLARRRSAGLVWVRRTRGVELLTRP